MISITSYRSRPTTGLWGLSGEGEPCESQVSVFLKCKLLQNCVSSLVSRAESQNSHKKNGEQLRRLFGK